MSMSVVPVMVRDTFSNRIVKEYAMSHTCSQATFAKENLLSDLGIQGTMSRYSKLSVAVKTMNGDVPKLSLALEDLEVA